MNFRKHHFLSLLAVIFALLILQSCGDNTRNPYVPDYSEAPAPFDTTEYVSKKTIDDEEGQVTVYTLQEGGSQDSVIYRDEISVKYTGRTTDGEIFESTYRDGSEAPRTLQNLTPESKQVGNSRNPATPLIDGFRMGLLGMHEGEKRTIVVPPALGYGETEDGETASGLQNETLVFDVELVQILGS